MPEKTRREGRRKLEVWLPESHHVWSLPPGLRAPAARRLLDLGAGIDRLAGMLEAALVRLDEIASLLAVMGKWLGGDAAGEAARLEEILRRLDAIEARLARLEAGGFGVAGRRPGGLDPAGFLAAFDQIGF
jgi:uncharacterized membrane protein YccC